MLSDGHFEHNNQNSPFHKTENQHRECHEDMQMQPQCYLQTLRKIRTLYT